MRRSERCLIAGSSVAALSLPLLLGVPGAAFATSSPYLTPTRAIVVTGILKDPTGATAPAGTPVYLQAWPSDDSLAGLAEGDEVNFVNVGSGQTDASGKYSIRYSSSDLSSVEDSNGLVDLDLTADVNGYEASAAFSHLGSTTLVTGPNTVTSDDDTGGPATVDMAASSSDVTDDSDGSSTQAVTPDGGGAGRCVTTLNKDYGSRWVQVGEGYTQPDSTGSFKYTKGAESFLEEGFSVSGKVGSFSASGTQSHASSTTIIMPDIKNGQGVKWLTQYKVGLFHTVGHVAGCQQGYRIRAYSFVGGNSTQTSSAPARQSKYCGHYKSGGIDETQTTAYNFSTGLDSGGLVGLKLSSRTGFSGSSTLSYRVQKPKDICGTAGQVGNGSPQRIEVLPYTG